MEQFEVGFSTAVITPDHMGFPMYGYGARKDNSTGVHDPLYAKTLVVKRGNEAWSLTVLDLIGIDSATVNAVRQMVAARTGLKPESMLISVIHTHSGPSIKDEGNWDGPFAEKLVDAITTAWESLQPAKVGVGAGFLYGYHVNRRWMERPVDPSVNVLRFDDLEGKPIAIAANFGLHPVVMGYDNFLISSDYVGVARGIVEKELGCFCLFANGAAGDVNPITKTVRKQLEERRSFVTMTGAFYFGRSLETIELADRAGGTFDEVEELGTAVGERIAYTACGIKTKAPSTPPWSISVRVRHSDEKDDTVESMAIGFGDWIAISEPGEIFVETGLDLKSRMRKLGFQFPWVVSYANDYQYYLAPQAAFPEGGYEVEMTKMAGHSPEFQPRLWAALEPKIPEAVPINKVQWKGFNMDLSEEEE